MSAKSIKSEPITRAIFDESDNILVAFGETLISFKSTNDDLRTFFKVEEPQQAEGE